jgi:hypothetical protein
MTTKAGNEHVENYRRAYAAHEQARADHWRFEKRDARGIEDWSPEVDATLAACLRTEIALHEAAAELNRKDPALIALKAWLAASLESVAERYDEVDRTNRNLPTLEAVTVSDLDTFCEQTAARTDPEYMRKAKTEVHRMVNAVFDTLDRALALLSEERKSSKLPNVPLLYSGAVFPALLAGGPIRTACTSAAACRALAASVRSFSPPDSAAGKKNELRLLELRHAEHADAVAKEEAARAARARDWDRRSPEFR